MPVFLQNLNLVAIGVLYEEEPSKKLVSVFELLDW
jgi:hypothetical protein